MSAEPCSLSRLCGHRHFIFKFARLLVHQEQRKNAAGFSWVLVRKGAADGLGGWKELAAKPPSPRVSLPRQSPERQARKAGEGSLFPVRPPRDGSVQGTATGPPGPEHTDLSTLLACLSCTPSCPCQALLLSASRRFSPVTLPTAVGQEALSSPVLEEKSRLGEVPP